MKDLRAAIAGIVFASSTAVVLASEPTITTVAGGGTVLGDGGPATSASVVTPTSLAVDPAGNLYIGQGSFDGSAPCRVRKVTPAGIITTFAGNGSTGGSNATNVAATEISICPNGLAVDRTGNVYIAEYARVRMVTPAGTATVIAGTGEIGFSGDGGSARTARFNNIVDVAVDAAGNVFVADQQNSRVRRIDTAGNVRTVAGNGTYSNSGNGGPATAAGMSPKAVEIDTAGRLLIVDTSGENTLRRVGENDIIEHVGGGALFRTDPVALNSHLYYLTGVAVDSRGAIYLSNRANIAHILSPEGILQVIAGKYNDTTFSPYGAWWGFGGDGGPATLAQLDEPMGIAVDAQGNVYIADSDNDRVRRVTPVALPRTPAGRGTFQPVAVWPVGANTVAQNVALGDVNGDRRLDAVVNTGSWTQYAPGADDYKINVFLQKTDGTLAPPTKIGMPTSRYVGALIIADIDRNGFGDIVSTNEFGINIIRSGPTGFGAPLLWQGIPNAEVPTSLTATDMDLDGRMDIVAQTSGRTEGGSSPSDLQGVTIFYGDGQGGVLRKHLVPSNGSRGRPLMVDVNRDGRADLVTAWEDFQAGNSGIAVFLHDGANNFRAPTYHGIGQRGFYEGLAVGDFDSNGLADFILSRGGNAPQAEQAHFRQTATGVLEYVRRWPTFDAPGTVLGADINGDGRDDLLTKHDGWSSIGYQEQAVLAGGAWLDSEIKYFVKTSNHASPYDMVSGDLNGDGCLDVAMADDNNGLEVLYAKQCLHARNGSDALVPVKTGAAGSPPPSSSPEGQSTRDEGAVHGTGTVPRPGRIVASVLAFLSLLAAAAGAGVLGRRLISSGRW